jgi:hypothetical protein
VFITLPVRPLAAAVARSSLVPDAHAPLVQGYGQLR